jgi:hypothetical protein
MLEVYAICDLAWLGHNDYDRCVAFPDEAPPERTSETVARFPRSPNNDLVCVLCSGDPQYLGRRVPTGIDKRKVDTLIRSELLRLPSQMLCPLAGELVARHKTRTCHCRRSCLDPCPCCPSDEHRHGPAA